MSALLPVGIIFTVLGLGGLGYFVWSVLKARKAGLNDEAMKARLGKLVAINLGSVAVSAIGLMIVIVALFLT